MIIDIFSEIKLVLRINEVFTRYGVKIDRHNKALCCFHNEKTPSLTIYPDTNSFHCFGCNVGGTAIDFVRNMFGLESLQAAHKLDNDFNLGLFDRKFTEAEKQVQVKIMAKRETEQKLAASYKAWESDYYDYLCSNIRLLEKLQEISKPYMIDGVPHFPDYYGYAINKRDILEYHWDIIYYGELEDKISLYLEITRTVIH